MSNNLIDRLVAAADYCLLCKKPSCVEGCPARVNIPGMMAHVQKHDFDAAYEENRKSNVLPVFCGILCPHEKQCEGHCIRLKKGKPVDIGFVEHGVASLFDNYIKKVDDRLHHLKIAIVGAGITGISAALQLSSYGADVTLFEKDEKIGGAVEKYLPDFRFDDTILEKIHQNLLDFGVKIHFHRELGKNLVFNDLFDYHYRILALGTQKPTEIDFEDMTSVYQGITILELAKDKQKLPFQNKSVLVIGAGNVSMDVARTLRRAGNHVTIVYRRTLEQSPASRKEILDAQDDGVEFIELLSPVETIVQDNRLIAMKFQEMDLDPSTPNGRANVHPVKDKYRILPSDGVVLALGSSADHDWMSELLRQQLIDEEGNLIVKGYRSAINNTFIGGDYLIGPQTVVKAMVAGRDIARQILILESYPTDSTKMRILLGGSFNPPTIAHLAMVKSLQSFYPNSEIYLVPNGDSYLRKNLIPFEERVRMLELAIADIPNVKILDLENNYPFRGTVVTLRELQHPYFVIGADSLLDLKTWIEYHNLVNENKFIVFKRSNIDMEDIFAKDEWLAEHKDHFIVLPCDIPNVSSTEFRKSLQPDLVPQAVYEYIMKHNLYQS